MQVNGRSLFPSRQAVFGVSEIEWWMRQDVPVHEDV